MRVTPRWIVCVCLTALSLACAGVPARAVTYVDGISDQSLPAWDGGFHDSYFAGLFHEAWVGYPGSHIAFARYVVQWNLMSGKYSRYLTEFEAWLTDVGSFGLKPMIALTSYDGSLPGLPREYRTRLQEILSRASALGHPIGWLEAWNEPNGQGNVSAVRAAGLANAASEVCEREYGCTVIAGDFEDSPDVARYEDEYIENLDPVPVNWGVHPYYSVEEESEAPFENVREHLPDKGEGERIWFTEVAARKCSDFDGRLVKNGESGQARRASWLVNTLIKNAKPEHVFYYEFLLKERKRPECQTEGSDSALYEPSADPAEPDRPRLAASYIWGGESAALASAALGYEDGGDAFMANAAQTTLTGGVGL